MPPLSIRDIQSTATKIRANVGKVIVGKGDVVDLALVALLCEGHILLEDVPGIGKTTLAKALARSLDCAFRRIQFTPDLLPSDVTGLAVYNQKNLCAFHAVPHQRFGRRGETGHVHEQTDDAECAVESLLVELFEYEIGNQVMHGRCGTVFGK